MICTSLDQYVVEFQEQNPTWTVTLNTGIVVYQDDYRVNESPSAWIRLYDHCQQTGDYIVDMSIQFRSNRKTLPPNADGYYFSKGVRGGFYMPKTMQLFFTGILTNNILMVTCWKTPEMLKETTSQRDPEKAGKCLIKKSIHRSVAQQD